MVASARRPADLEVDVAATTSLLGAGQRDSSSLHTPTRDESSVPYSPRDLPLPHSPYLDSPRRPFASASRPISAATSASQDSCGSQAGWADTPRFRGSAAVLERYGSPSPLAEKFSLRDDPDAWGSPVTGDFAEPDDDLHNYDPKRDGRTSVLTCRGFVNLGFLFLLACLLIGLFAGYPLAQYFSEHKLSNQGGFNAGGINASGQIPLIPNNFGLVDPDTPAEAQTIKSFADGSEWTLVFSDEFEQDGRTFWPGDDPYWEAVDLHNWQTGDMEWYSPQAVTTRNGSLEITVSEKEINNLDYLSGSLSTWNKFCFTGGLILVSVSLPGSSSVSGLWPAVWTMGNLGRVGYGASLDGMWPYVYDSCDVGTVVNQTHNGVPKAALTGGSDGGTLSFLPGQRLSRCTCPGESHPGPKHSDGTYVGRSAPEIDIFEAQVTGGPDSGGLSQSAQFAPFNYNYTWLQTGNSKIPDPDVTMFNPYKGGIYQQATSAVTRSNPDCFDQNTGCFATYGYEYQPGYKNESGYISWIANDKVSWTLEAGGVAADPKVGINDRPITSEPMYIIANVAISNGFSYVDTANLVFPTKMRVDWVRVYQPKDAVNVGCDPVDYPTSAYIQQFSEAYNNPNLTTWTLDRSAGGFDQAMPKNSFLGQC
ncbi:glycoside hydrolase family 16 protein [Coniophora puteana RWD-64-598 SS2]|uniref:Glycoside hydrolase family 16 protein n=1 Tax=Coniophora puteana (strain RWD-64-598) TaxID=741705 RepID=A0A5M3MGF8_CONPW|nr:glycoside hydrolase family 16 protein [Coniophora puteana RWD-64-598 SS2]EIW78253.1 glycoside hydrolase family 16 protein [Coniophora puteana RWD-64-598 SS2]